MELKHHGTERQLLKCCYTVIIIVFNNSCMNSVTCIDKLSSCLV